MQIVYEDSVLSKISDAVNDARLCEKKIKKIFLNTTEMDELCKELGGQSSGTFDYRVIPFKDFLVVESMLK